MEYKNHQQNPVSYATLRFLNANWSDDSVYEPYDIRHSVVYDDLLSSQFLSPDSWIDIPSQQPFNNSSWYTESFQYDRGGIWHSYSQKWWINCDAGNSSFWFENQVSYYWSKMVIVTDGTCGSACSLFSSKMGYYGAATLVSVGGIFGHVAETSSFTGVSAKI